MINIGKNIGMNEVKGDLFSKSPLVYASVLSNEQQFLEILKQTTLVDSLVWFSWFK